MKGGFALLGFLVVGCSDMAEPLDPDPEGACLRRILETQVTNARDLGGWPVAEGIVSCGRIFRGGALTQLAGEGCEKLSALGVNTIVDLREQIVQDTAPPPACVSETAKHVSAPLPKLLPDTPENYLALLNEAEAIRQLFSMLSTAASYPVYVHCEIGRDRASFASALILLAVGASDETVMEEFLLSGKAGVTVKGECMSAVLGEITARGGIEAYLLSVGVDSDGLERLRPNVVQEAP
jgi:protein-tyrosine phosphatase